MCVCVCFALEWLTLSVFLESVYYQTACSDLSIIALIYVNCAYVTLNLEQKCNFNKRSQSIKVYAIHRSVILIFFLFLTISDSSTVSWWCSKELACCWNGMALHKQQCFHWSAETVLFSWDFHVSSCDSSGSCEVIKQALQPAIMNTIAMQFAPCTMQVSDLCMQSLNINVY